MTADNVFRDASKTSVFDPGYAMRSSKQLDWPGSALDVAMEQLSQSHRSIAELCYEHREWQRSIEVMLSAIDESTTMMPTLPTLLQENQDAEHPQQMEGVEHLQNEQQGREERGSFNSTVTPKTSAPLGMTGVTHLPSGGPSCRPRSTKTSVPVSSVSSERYRPARHFYKSPRSFRGSLLQSRNTVKQCPAGPLRKLLLDLLKTSHETREDSSSFQNARRFISVLVSSSWFEYASGLVILLNVITIGLEAELSLEGSEWESTSWFAGAEKFFLSIYCAEALLRAFGLGRVVLADGWYLLDLFLILIVTLTLAIVPMLASDFASLRKLLVVRGLRLLWLMRVCRMVHHFKIIWRLVYGFLTSWQTLFATAVLILVSIFVFSCIAIEIIAKDSDLTTSEVTGQIVLQNFWGVGRSMLTMAQFVTLDGLRDIYYPLIMEKPWLAAYFFAIVLVISIGLLNLVTACLVQTAMSNAAQNLDEERARLKGKVLGALPQLILIFSLTLMAVDSLHIKKWRMYQ